LDAINLIGGAWLLLTGLIAAAMIVAARRKNAILYVIAIHSVYSGIPLLLDVLTGAPTYGSFAGLRAAAFDEQTSFVYVIYACACPVLWWLVGRGTTGSGSRASERIRTIARSERLVKIVLWGFLISPIFFVFFAPDPTFYLSYGRITGIGVKHQDIILYHGMVNVMSTAAICVGPLLLTLSRSSVWLQIGVSAQMVIAAWLNGKRFIVALALLLLFLVTAQRNTRKRTKLFITGFAIVVLVGGFAVAYQLVVRNYTMQNPERVYDSLRVDFGRDRSIKLAIYRELYPEAGPILEYRGESALFPFVAVIPRSIWPGKPWPYYVYFTSAALQMYGQKYIDWGMTTSWLDEAIANFGIAGFLIGPLLLAWICRLADRSKFAPFQILSVTVCALILSVDVSAWLLIAAMWVALLLLMRLDTKVVRVPGRGYATRRIRSVESTC